jgi:Uma2 family endonuclease
MVTTATDYERLALAEPEQHWEFHDGRLAAKGPMTAPHNEIAFRILRQIVRQLPEGEWTARLDSGRLRNAAGSYYEPDLVVIPIALFERRLMAPDRLEVYDEPVPLVVEVWSPSTGRLDIDTKIPEYQRRGDAEIWRVHPYDRSVTVYRRQPDGRYTTAVYHGGTVTVASLLGVTVDLDRIFP